MAGSLQFRDHHAFVPADIDRIATELRAAQAEAVLTTEKDLVRLLMHRPWPFRLAVLPLSVGVEPASEFSAWLADRVARARERRTA